LGFLEFLFFAHGDYSYERDRRNRVFGGEVTIVDRQGKTSSGDGIDIAQTWFLQPAYGAKRRSAWGRHERSRIDPGQFIHHLVVCQPLTKGGLVMYALIIVIGVISSGSSVIPVGVTSQIVGKFKNLDECKAAASQPHAGGPVADITLVTTWGVNWYCTYAGAN
jgi:hypothetical protein